MPEIDENLYCKQAVTVEIHTLLAYVMKDDTLSLVLPDCRTHSA